MHVCLKQKVILNLEVLRLKNKETDMRYKGTIFSKLIKAVPRREFEEIVKKHSGDYRVRKMNCWDQMLGMVYNQLSQKTSLRDLELSFNSHHNNFYHLGCNRLKRSTLADANKNRSYKIYEEVFQKLVSRIENKKKTKSKEVTNLLKAIDATVITLNKTQFGWAKGYKNKMGVKVHTVYDINAEVPIHFEITTANLNDITYASKLDIRANTTYVFDKGYYKFAWWYEIDSKQSYFITPIKKNSPTEILKEREIKSNKILRDQEVSLSKRLSHSRKNPYQKSIRKITVKREEGKEPIILLTNDMTRTAKEIADLYKKRWQIELFFKWIKQNLKIKKFLGRSENALKIQVITALISFLLIKYFQNSLPFKKSMQTCARLIQSNLMIKKDLIELFSKPPDKSIREIDVQLRFQYA